MLGFNVKPYYQKGAMVRLIFYWANQVKVMDANDPNPYIVVGSSQA